MVDVHNLLKLPPRQIDERFESLLERPGLKLERITSWGQATAPGQWYDQPQDEWVLLVTGESILTIEGDPPLRLRPFDHLLLPAHCRHRVEWTHPDEPTVWLALHYFADAR